MTEANPILIADDDEGVCRLLQGALRKEGIRAECRQSGQAALDYLRAHETPLLLLDLRLPDMRGQDLVEILAEEGRPVPFVVISGISDLRVAVHLMQEGAMDFLAKDPQLLQLVAPVTRRCLDALERNRRLAQVEQDFRHLAENIQAVFWIATPAFERVLYCNPAFERVWGRSVAALQDSPATWLDAVTRDDLPSVRESRRGPRGEGERVEIEYRIHRPDGATRWIQEAVQFIPCQGAAPARLTGLARDITDKKNLDRRVLEAAEQERQRLGRDLHDDLCQRLAAIKLRCGLLERALSKDGHPIASEAADVAKHIAEATALSRGLARGLAPVDLGADGLTAALAELANTAKRLFGVEVEFAVEGEPPAIEPGVGTHVYRIAQELVNNAAKHARPSKITIKLDMDRGRPRLEVENDGQPFVEPDGANAGMGLHFLRSRAAAIDATLTFTPSAEENGGSRVSCVLPEHSNNNAKSP